MKMENGDCVIKFLLIGILLSFGCKNEDEKNDYDLTPFPPARSAHTKPLKQVGQVTSSLDTSDLINQSKP